MNWQFYVKRQRQREAGRKAPSERKTEHAVVVIVVVVVAVVCLLSQSAQLT